MISVISPAKTLDPNPNSADRFTIPVFLKESKTLVNLLKKKKRHDLMEMMGISEKLADQNYKRFRSFDPDFNPSNSNTTIYTFKGEVYLGLNAEDFSDTDLDFAQENLRILSGLYGILKPLDLMQEYRLEMGTSLENRRGNNLYKFWGDHLTKSLNEELSSHESKFLINLASNEYFKALNKKKLKASVIDVSFFDQRENERVFVSFNAKKARGMMASFIIKNKLVRPEDLKGFDDGGYVFDAAASTENQFTFVKH